MEEQHVVYVHINKINGKVYVGQTKSIKRRWKMEGIDYQKSSYFYNAIQKYGWDNFEHKILKEGLSQEEANYWEDYYINYYDSLNHKKGYNIRHGGTHGALSEETKQKLSQICKEKGLWKGDLNPRHIDPLYGERNGMYGKHHTEETKQKISQANTGRKMPEEAKKKISATLRQHHVLAKKVMCIETGEIFNSIRQAAEFYHISHQAISRVCRGERKTTAGKYWKYIEGENNDFN